MQNVLRQPGQPTQARAVVEVARDRRDAAGAQRGMPLRPVATARTGDSAGTSSGAARSATSPQPTISSLRIAEILREFGRPSGRPGPRRSRKDHHDLPRHHQAQRPRVRRGARRDRARRPRCARAFRCRTAAATAPAARARERSLAGTVDYGRYQPTALPDADREAGFALFCQAKPLSDLVIESREIGAVRDIPIKTLPCRVQKLERLAPDVMALHLRLPANERLQFLAGQYIEILLKDGKRRAFSMANAPHDDELLQLHLRHYAGGTFTEYVFSRMKEREILRFEGPFGTFFLREDSDEADHLPRERHRLRADQGRSLEHAFHRGIERPMVLYWGARARPDLYLDALARQWADDASATSATCRCCRKRGPRTSGPAAPASCTGR